jgi:hypothetical protein
MVHPGLVRYSNKLEKLVNAEKKAAQARSSREFPAIRAVVAVVENHTILGSLNSLEFSLSRKSKPFPAVANSCRQTGPRQSTWWVI